MTKQALPLPTAVLAHNAKLRGVGNGLGVLRSSRDGPQGLKWMWKP